MKRIFYAILFFLPALYATAQTMQTEFGKNRVQFHSHFDEWSQYESRNFITYWYGEGRLIGQSVVMMAEYDFYEIQGILEHRMNDKIEIIVYTDISDLRQSNIGSEEAFENTGGQTKIVGNKIFVYFNGNHNDLRRQIREGVASVFLNAMLFGSNLQEIVQNAIMVNLPQWFKDGLISYVGEEWSVEKDNQLRDIFLSGKFDDFEKMAAICPKVIGHSFWYYISKQYGKSSVSNLLYLTRINRSLESGFLYVLGSSYQGTQKGWYDFYKKRYETETADMAPPKGTPIAIKNKYNLPLSQVKISPDGTKVAYVSNEIGKVKVYLQDLATGDRKVIFKYGFRNAIQATDYNYPLIAWSPTNMELAIVYERRDVVRLLKYNVLTKEKTVDEMAPEYQRIYSIDYINPNDLVLSAAVRGQSDLFLYFTVTRQSQRLTTDFWDDLDAVFVQVHGQRGILFTSNRPDSLNLITPLDSVLPIRNFDIFYLNLDSVGFSSAGELVQVTHTPYANERRPVAIDSVWFGFLSDESGVFNRKTGRLEDYIHHFENVISFKNGDHMRLHADSIITEKLDSAALAQVDSVWTDTIIKQRAINHFVSNYDRSILEQSKARRSDQAAELIFRDGAWQLYTSKIAPEQIVSPAISNYQKLRIQLREAPPEMPPPSKKNVLEEKNKEPIDVSRLPKEKLDTGKIDIDNYLFQSEFDDEEVPVRVTTEEPKAEDSGQAPKEEAQRPLVNRNTVQEAFVRRKTEEFRSSRIIPYRLKFRTDFVTTQLDNSQLFDGLNDFSGVPEDFGYPPPGILIKANFKDLLEDYEFEGGIRIPTSFNGAEYFLFYHDKKKRLDKRYAFYRRRLRFTLDNTPPALKYDNSIFLTQFQVRYPLDVFTSLRGTATLRFDNTQFLATDLLTLQAPDLRHQRLGLRGEYVFDNTLDVAINIKNGTRYKVFAEIIKGMQIDLGQNGQFKLNDGFMTVVGFDFRHYERFLKYSILAGRLAGATSFGKEKIFYMLGGTDNWLFPQFDMTIPFPGGGEDFAYRAIATNMRGFQLNARNGNSYAVLNAEIRMPVLRYLFQRSASNFVRNFQIVGFFDAGTAWQGMDPFSESSPLNTWTSSNNNVNIEVNYFRDPIVFGYGAGIRTLLFGYFVRLDYAWGIETRQVQEPKLYFSIGMDF